MARTFMMLLLCGWMSGTALATDLLAMMDADLCSQLGDDWNVRKSGQGYLATRVTPKKADSRMLQKVNDQMRDFRDNYKDAQAMRIHDEILLRGRIDDCGDAAQAAASFAAIAGINRIFVDVSCAR